MSFGSHGVFLILPASACKNSCQSASLSLCSKVLAAQPREVESGEFKLIEILETVGPIFIIIFLGLGLLKIGLLPQHLHRPVNQLAYYVAIPAMIFHKIAIADFDTFFQWPLMASILVTPLLVLFISYPIGRLMKAERSEGTFVHSTFQGNIGFVGLAVAYYALGDNGLISASILTGFLIVGHNIIGVAVLTASSAKWSGTEKVPLNFGKMAHEVLVHPLIISSTAGIMASIFHLHLPGVIDKSLDLLGGMALPLGLLLIGASLSLKSLKGRMKYVTVSALIKNMAMPAVGLILFKIAGLEAGVFLPGLIILGSPTATMVFIMAREMKGDPELASACVSFSTLVCALTYSIWLHFMV